jgi:hypothetical protein
MERGYVCGWKDIKRNQDYYVNKYTEIHVRGYIHRLVN